MIKIKNQNNQEKNIELASFAMGCFWGPDYFFSQLPGVLSTRVGYMGGTTKSPTYDTLGDHTETVEITFYPSKVSFETLLRIFWENHDPTLKQKTRYQSILFYHNASQQFLAEKSLEFEKAHHEGTILTELRKATEFYEAEDYHQKYFEKHKKLYS